MEYRIDREKKRIPGLILYRNALLKYLLCSYRLSLTDDRRWECILQFYNEVIL